MTVYADFAATSAVRPAQVTDAVADYLRRLGATPGRGAYAAALEAGRVALRCRTLLARLLGLPGDPGRIAFMMNATHALNTALNGVLGPGDVCVRTVYDHNAVVRPLHALAGQGVEVRVLDGDADGAMDLDAARRAMAGARLVVLNAASNVLGCTPPLEALADAARASGALVLLDSAQMAGHAPLSAEAMDVDLLAFTGHKGLLGPQGTGGLWVREGVAVRPLLRGGTGGDSREPEMPEAYPDHLEAGTQNGPGIAGLAAGLDWLLEYDVARLRRRLEGLRAALDERVRGLDGVRVVSTRRAGGAPIVTLVARTVAPAELAHRLDRLGVACRAGLHCAPDAHRMVGTGATGAVRFSLGWCSTEDDVETIADRLERALSGTVDTPIAAQEAESYDG